MLLPDCCNFSMTQETRSSSGMEIGEMEGDEMGKDFIR
jgi:hypothetical protein